MKSINRAKGEKGEATRARILRAAAECIASVGVEKTSITRIVARARVSRGLVAYYFPKKSRLFDEVILWIASEANQALARASTPLEIVRGNMDFLHANPTYARCYLLMFYYSSYVPRFRELYSKIEERGVLRLTEAFAREGVSNDEASTRAHLAHRLLVGTILKLFTTNRNGGYERFRKQSMELLALLCEK